MAGVAEIARLGAGEKVALGRSVYARRNKDLSVTFLLRKKVEGKTKDVTLSNVDKATKQAIDAAYDAASAARKEKHEPKPKADVGADVAAPGKLTAKSTMREVWLHQVADIEGSGFWSDTNLKLNKGRIAAHCEKWSCWETSIGDVTSDDLTPPLLALRNEFPHQCKKVTGLVSGVFRHAAVEKIIGADPMPDVLKRLRHNYKAKKPQHFDALLDIEKLRELVVAIRNMTGDASVRNALFLQAMTGQRTGEVIGATWGEFDLDDDVPRWVIPRSRMKIKDENRGDQVLHLAPQVVEFLKTLPRSKSGLLFPGRVDGATVTSESVSKAMRLTLKMKDKHTPHGWRSSIATLARRASVDESGRPLFAEAWIEGLLDHLSGDAVKDAYNRGGHAEGVGRVLAWWASQLLDERK